MASQYLARLGIVLGIDSGELVSGIEKAKKEFKQFTNEVQKDTKAALREADALRVATEDYGKTLTKVQQIEREIATGKYRFASQEAKDAILAQAKAYDAVALSGKKANAVLTEQQKMAVTYQLTDFFTQIASGQNAMIAFIQQGGQLKDSMGGVGNAFKALTSFITPMRVGIAAVATAVGSVAYAFYKAKDELDKFKDSMTLTGQYAGIAYAQFVQLGDAISKKTGAAIGDTREILGELVGSGKFTSQSLDSVSSAILKFSRVAGVDAKDAAKQLIPLLDGTASSAKQLNDKYHFLTLAQYKQIEALERQGRLQEAAKITADALSESLDKTKRDLGNLESAWKAVHDWASKTWDAMLGWGREAGFDRAKELETKINQMEAWLEKRRDKLPASDLKAREAQLKTMRDELNEIVTRIGNEMNVAEARSAAAQKAGAGIKSWDKAGGLAGQLEASKAAKKAQFEANFAIAEMYADEEQRIEIELQKKIALAKLDEAEKNEKTLGQYQAHWAAERVAKVAEAEAEAERKRFELRKKEAWEAASKEFDEETNIMFRLMRERDKIMNDAQDKQEEQKFAREELDLRFSLIGATQKELDIMRAKIAAQKELDRLTRTKEFISMSEQQQSAAKKIYEDTLQAKIANIELAESLQRLQGMYDTVWSNMSSAIENFVRTGKFSIKDFTRSVIQDMLIMNMKLQAMTLLRGLFNSLFPSAMGMTQMQFVTASGGRAFANGGSPPVGVPSLVGERGPELFVPRTAGTIIPNNQLSGMGGTTNVTNNYINAIDAKSFEQRLLESSTTIWAANTYANKSLASNGRRA